jgi:hypothetical protein
MGLITKHFYTATPSKVAERKEQISKLGQQKPAQCRNRQIQQQGAVPAKYKIEQKKDRKNVFYPVSYFLPPTGITNKN